MSNFWSGFRCEDGICATTVMTPMMLKYRITQPRLAAAGGEQRHGDERRDAAGQDRPELVAHGRAAVAQLGGERFGEEGGLRPVASSCGSSKAEGVMAMVASSALPVSPIMKPTG